jgi:porphobilinogen synthase
VELPHRPRRLRAQSAIRSLVRETTLQASDFVLPVFLCEGQGICEAISALEGVYRRSLDELLIFSDTVVAAGILGLGLFPKVDDGLKNPTGSEAYNPQGLLPQAVRALKARHPQLLIFTDIALDPYNSDGHDGIVMDGEVQNDLTVDALCRQALVHAQAGADFICPSDMMDGRIGALRSILDQNHYSHVGIMSYCAKYASALYGPFRSALDSAPKIQEGKIVPKDKKSYQMDPANTKEALRELALDLAEGADMVMVKPALYYLDIISKFADRSTVPVAAYHVSGEYAMVCAAAQAGLCDLEQTMLEALVSIKRAGAKVIWSYYALEAAQKLSK